MSYVMRYSRSQPQPTLYIWNNKTLELTSIVTHTPMFYTAMEFTYTSTPTPITTMSEHQE